MSNILQIFHDTLDAGVNCIPCRKIRLDDGTYSGKIPAIKEWSKYCDEELTAEEIDSWAPLSSRMSGIAYVTGEASNLCCIDIDTEDDELIRRIKDVMPYSPCVIVGNPLRGGKHLFRLKEYPGDRIEILNPKQSIKCPHTNKSIVDFFFGNAYICAPPSIHSVSTSGIETYYKWERNEMALDRIGIDALPVLSIEVISKIKMAVEGMTPTQMIQNLPLSTVKTDKPDNASGGRWATMTELAGGLIKSKVPPLEAVHLLLDKDRQMFSSNLYFGDKSKGSMFEHPWQNAMKLYTDLLYKDFGNRKWTSADLGFSSAQEIIGESCWTKPKDIKDLMRISEMDVSVIPESIRAPILKAAELTCVKPEAIFMHVLAGFSSLLGNKRIIKPYPMQSYKETSNLYVILVSPSGSRKSQITNLALSALNRLESEIKKENMEMVKKAESANKIIKARLAKNEKEIKKEIERPDLEMDANGNITNDLVKELEAQNRLLEGRLVVVEKASLIEKDITPEALYGAAENNSSGLLLEINEFSSEYKNLSRKESSKMRKIYLDGWDGLKSLKYTTKHQGENYIEKFNLSIATCIQNEPMKQILADLQGDYAVDDGLIQRFLISYPESPQIRVVDDVCNLEEVLYPIFKNAYAIEPSVEPVRLEQSAYLAWKSFQDDYLYKQLQSDCDGTVKSFISKYSGLVIRVAHNLAVLKNNGNPVMMIDKAAYMDAQSIIKHVEANVRFLYNEARMKSVEELIMRFKSKVFPDGMTLSQMKTRSYSMFKDSSLKMNDVLKVLLETDNVRLQQDENNEYIVRVNPELLQ